MSGWGPGCVKTHLSRGRAELFSQLSSRRRSRGAIGFHNDEIETEILRAGSTSEFSHSLGQKRKSRPCGGMLLCPGERTSSGCLGMSEKCQKRKSVRRRQNLVPRF